MLRRLLRTCHGGAAGNRTLTPSELAQLAQAELDLASGKAIATATAAGAGVEAAAGTGKGVAAGAGVAQGATTGVGASGTGAGALQDQAAAQKQAAGGR